MQSNQYLIGFYSNYDEEKRLLLRHGSVEFLTTMRYIEKYVTPDSHMLGIGAGTERYSRALARQGHIINVVELIECNIEIFRKNIQPGENITITQGSAINLSAFSDDTYNITPILGPLYHSYNITDKRQALREAVRVTKPGGVVFTAYVISDDCFLDGRFMHGNINVAEYIKNDLLDSKTFATKSKPKDLFELVRKEDIDHIMSVLSVNHLHYVAADDTALLMRDAIDKMNQDTLELYLKYHFAICERTDLIDIANHAIDMFRKPT